MGVHNQTGVESKAMTELIEASLEDEVSRKLYAARAVAWRGKADLPQFAWRCPCHGLILLVDLWAGIGGLPLALLALGVRCIVLSAESDPELRQAKRSIFPNIVEIEDVAMVTGKMLHKVISRRSFAAFVIGGGSPMSRQFFTQRSQTRP